MSREDIFISGLVQTNKSHAFFTDWEKARNLRDVYKDELALLGVLYGNKDIESELRRLLNSYPRINALIPLLNAVRPKQKSKKETPYLIVLDEEDADDIQYTFSNENLSQEEIAKTVDFAKKTGLLSELRDVKNFTDYYFGVEVGLDSNARKNRSGDAMEQLVEPYVRELTAKFDGQYLTQTTFKKAGKIFNVKVPRDQAGKKGDFMMLVNGKPTNIEVNFFDDGGSKQEIMNSYIPRAQDLRSAGWGFALVTDGLGWRSNKSQVRLGFERIGNIYNLSMCSEGLLEELLNP